MWRIARAWRLPWILLFIISLILINNIYTSKPQIYKSDTLEHPKGDLIKHGGDLERIIKARTLSKLEVANSKHGSTAMLELSDAVKEDEDVAKEVDGMDRIDEAGEMNAIDQGNQDAQIDELNAANEVNSNEAYQSMNSNNEDFVHSHEFNNWRNLSSAEIGRMSTLGRIMFLNEPLPEKKNNQFLILVWKYGPTIERRLIKQYGAVAKDPFEKCSVHNCELTYKDSAISKADAVMVHFHRTKGPDDLPNRTRADQRWIWLTDESMQNTFMVAKNKDISQYNGKFNWSMNYRMNADVPVPYGRTFLLTDTEKLNDNNIDYFALKNKTIAIMGSNCGGTNGRWKYVKLLQEQMQVDTYGGCGTLKCPGHFTKDCPLLNQYKFYLAFENTNCDEYLTEKVWWNAIEKGAVPVVLGSNKEVYKKLLPPGSFIYVEDFKTPKELAKHLSYVASNREAYNRYHAWRRKFKVVNEHGYFASAVYHYCRICEALNYNDPRTQVYNHLEDFWHKDKHCYKSKWQKNLEEAQGKR
ncbi:unnamed protein product [Meganyctiphanes norvegica]|uniref:Fucosyltransferase n=1 Tax=Meganyctiphanes norvegica TaxID=48144 RepID=A0AAV2QQA0_MEGNR